MLKPIALFTVFLGLFVWPLSAQAEEANAAEFVEANILATFYHELGHAVIDIESVPVFGQEEDAADVFSIYMIDALFEEQTAQELAFDAAFGFLGEADARQKAKAEIAWWGVHGPDEQRFFNMVCLFYGANPGMREDFAIALGLPEDRAIGCEGEFTLADESWGPILDDMEGKGTGKSIRMGSFADSLTADILRDEIAALNERLTLSQTLTVHIEECGEANAFYYPGQFKITFCKEFEDYLFILFDGLE